MRARGSRQAMPRDDRDKRRARCRQRRGIAPFGLRRRDGSTRVSGAARRDQVVQESRRIQAHVVDRANQALFLAHEIVRATETAQAASDDDDTGDRSAPPTGVARIATAPAARRTRRSAPSSSSPSCSWNKVPEARTPRPAQQKAASASGAAQRSDRTRRATMGRNSRWSACRWLKRVSRCALKAYRHPETMPAVDAAGPGAHQERIANPESVNPTQTRRL